MSLVYFGYYLVFPLVPEPVSAIKAFRDWIVREAQMDGMAAL